MYSADINTIQADQTYKLTTLDMQSTTGLHKCPRKYGIKHHEWGVPILSFLSSPSN